MPVSPNDPKPKEYVSPTECAVCGMPFHIVAVLEQAFGTHICFPLIHDDKAEQERETRELHGE